MKDDLLVKCVEDIYEHYARTAVKNFNQDGQCFPQLHALWCDPGQGEITNIVVIDSRLVIKFFEDSTMKQAMMLFVDGMLTLPPPTRVDEDRPADFVVQISEAWAVTRQSKAAADAVTAPSKCADRREVIIISVHSKNRTFSGACPIHDAPTRHAEYNGMMTTTGGGMVRQRETETH